MQRKPMEIRSRFFPFTRRNTPLSLSLTLMTRKWMKKDWIVTVCVYKVVRMRTRTTTRFHRFPHVFAFTSINNWFLRCYMSPNCSHANDDGPCNSYSYGHYGSVDYALIWYQTNTVSLETDLLEVWLNFIQIIMNCQMCLLSHAYCEAMWFNWTE